MERHERAREIVDQLVYHHWADGIGDVARKLGYNPTAFSAALTGRIPFSDKMARKLCEIDDNLNLNWLLTGDGSMLNEEIEETPKTLNFKPSTCEKNGVPFYQELKVSAGQTDFFDHNQSSETMWVPGVQADAYFFVIGCSMQPDINPGDIIGVRRVERFETIDPSAIYMIVTNQNERMIKHIQPTTEEEDSLTLVSDNPQYKPFQIQKDSILQVLRVNFIGKRL